MKKVDIEKVMHLASTSRSGKGNNKRYAFKDFSDLIDVRDSMRKTEPKQKKVKPNKIVKIQPGGSMYINKTHIFVGSVGWIVIDRYLTPNKVRNLYPDVLEMMHSIDNEVFGDHIVFNNAH